MEQQKLNLKISNKKIEHEIWKNNKLIIGIDEVGRGCLFGPLAVGIVILKIQKNLPDFLVDSKKISEKKRILAKEWIEKNSIFNQVILTPAYKLDQENLTLVIKKAVLKGLSQINNNLLEKTNLIATDLMHELPESFKNVKLQSFKNGEDLSLSIAAASIVAKVKRDCLMKKNSYLYSSYLLEKNKGYGTKDHLEKIKKNGISVLHRLKFLRKF